MHVVCTGSALPTDLSGNSSCQGIAWSDRGKGAALARPASGSRSQYPGD
jgi:hypothetical protein